MRSRKDKKVELIWLSDTFTHVGFEPVPATVAGGVIFKNLQVRETEDIGGTVTIVGVLTMNGGFSICDHGSVGARVLRLRWLPGESGGPPAAAWRGPGKVRRLFFHGVSRRVPEIQNCSEQAPATTP